MPATATVERLASRSERRVVAHAPGSAAANQIVDLGQPQGAGNKCIPINQFRAFIAGLFRVSGTGTTTKFALFAATSADGTANATDIVLHALPNNKPAAVGDVVWLECDIEQIHEVL